MVDSTMESMEKQARALFLAKRYREAADKYAGLARADPTQPKWCTNGSKCFYIPLGAASEGSRTMRAGYPKWERGYECHAHALIAMGDHYKAVQVSIDDHKHTTTHP
jgi:hypothetical protein